MPRLHRSKSALTGLAALGLPLSALGGARPAHAQETPPAAAAPDTSLPSVTPLFETTRFLRTDLPLALRLSRPLTRAEGRIALFIGSVDVSGLVTISDSGLVYHPAAALELSLPTGRTEIAAFVVTRAGRWRELGRFPLMLLSRGGFEQAGVAPKADLASSGPLTSEAEGGQVVQPNRQAFTVNTGFRSTLARPGWTLTTQANALGANGSQRLRFGEMQDDAPDFDLADYLVQAERGRAALAVGNVRAGSSRHLIADVMSRGVTGSLPVGRVMKLDLAALNATPLVGWDNPVGVTQPDHRMLTATLGLELRPAQPGVAHVDVSVLDGRKLPVAGYGQGAVTDAEESRGMAVQLSGADPKQRVRLAAGVTRSRFLNPADRLLSRDSTIVEARATTRSARYVDAAVQLLQNHNVGKLPVSLGAGLRHERVDPLFRSIGAVPRADYQQSGGDVTAVLGPLNVRVARSKGEDNLGRVASVLTSETRDDNVTAAVPLGQLVRLKPAGWWWPSLTYMEQRTHYAAPRVPAGGGFTAADLPDLASTSRNAGASWQIRRLNVGYRWTQSLQDNRQPSRARSDVYAAGHGVTLGFTPAPALTLTLDAADEFQENRESDTRLRTRRAGLQGDWRVHGSTALSAYGSLNRTSDRPRTQRRGNTEARVEASQGFSLYRHPAGATQARAFLRYSRSAARVVPVLGAPDQMLWALTGGLSCNLF